MRYTISALVAVALSSSVRADILDVPQEFPTIQTAIVASKPGDLVIVAPGVYNEQIDFLGKAISVIGSGSATATVIDASGLVGWNDAPFYAVVRFINGEGPGSVLQGFTITGHSNSSSLSAPVYSLGTPTLVGCHIVNNTGLSAGGFFGDGTLSGCLIDNNRSGGAGGGVRGPAKLYDCTISRCRTTSSNGGGIYAELGSRAVRCIIVDNSAAGDGHSAGGVFGPAELIDCLVARNEGDEFGGQNTAGSSAVEGALLMDGCTVTENVFLRSFGPSGYAVKNVATIVDSIIWNNDEDLGEVFDSPTTYSCVDGGAAGVGNIALDPLFANTLTQDYTLQRTSPCVDAGDPASALDPDGTPADMGAFFVPQFAANWQFRFGTTFNLDYVPQGRPVLGSTWQADVAAGPGMSLTVILAYGLPSSPIPSPYGEILVDLTSGRVFQDIATPQAGTSSHSIAIPNDPALIGVAIYTQAVQLGGPVTLTNAVDLLLGL